MTFFIGGSIAAVPGPDDAVKSSVSKNRGTDVRQLVDRHQRDGVLPSLVERDSSVATGNSNDPTTTPSDKPIYEKPWVSFMHHIRGEDIG